MATMFALALTSTLYLLWTFVQAALRGVRRHDAKETRVAALGAAIGIASLVTIAAIASSNLCVPKCRPLAELAMLLN